MLLRTYLRRLEDEMYDKILTMERVMQAEIDQLKERELELITCMQKDREAIMEEKMSVEKVHLFIIFYYITVTVHVAISVVKPESLNDDIL